MNQTDPNEAGPEASGKLQENDQRRKRAVKLGLITALAAWIVAFAVYAGLKSIRSNSSIVDIILLLWSAVIIGAPFIGLWVYKKNK